MVEQNLVIDPKAVMSHFCWAFTKALADRLEELITSGRLWVSTDDLAGPEVDFTHEGDLVVRCLMHQLQWPVPSPETPWDDIQVERESVLEIVQEARTFLAVFEKKP